MEELEAFMEWLKSKRQESVDEMVEEVGEEHRELVEKREDIRERVFDTFTDMEMDSGVAEILQSQVKEFIEEVKEIDLSKAVLAKMVKHNSSIADHALNTANVAIYMAMVLGHGNYQVLEDIYMGALFHDYAKLKIDPKVLENKSNNRYNQAIQDHPRKGSVAVKKLDNIREPVIKIVEQHHEQFNGNGYPNGLKEDEIFGPAMIVSMANIFDNTVVENKNKPKKEKYRMAIKVLEYDKGKQFDPDMIEKVITALKLAYGEYYIPPANS
jgi:HD-GYP domain-containing protein (c-di-GMP phosphodiesterase class II)